jgi:hypothetical protein
MVGRLYGHLKKFKARLAGGRGKVLQKVAVPKRALPYIKSDQSSVDQAHDSHMTMNLLIWQKMFKNA